MSRIKIEALTAVHIGSGESFQYGTDFVAAKHDEQDVLSIVDPRKVMELIGENNVYQWVAAIERKEATSKVVKQFAPNAKIDDYSKRIIMEWSAAKPSDTLKEQIHDGRGVPYIPGSSIKGAIRTAIVATLADKVGQKEKKIDKTKRDFQGNPIPDKRGKIQLKANAQKIEAELFGFNPKMENVDPNKDIFRFLHVGDAYFGKNYEVAIRMVNINERESQGFWDQSKSQLIEAICPEDSAVFQMKINLTGYNLSKMEGQVSKIPACMQSVSALFETINAHTLHLLETEKEYWQEREANDASDHVANYLEKIEDMLDTARKCEKGKECVLRIGYGSGWRFITGAWAEDLDNFTSLVVPASRPKNDNYTKYDFPKTRRVDDQCELLGFVKLSILE